MRTFFICLAGLVIGYVLTAVASAYGVMAFSSNTHDRALEATMTAAFVAGPIGGILGAISGWMWSRRR